jgi:hypothetical protein
VVKILKMILLGAALALPAWGANAGCLAPSVCLFETPKELIGKWCSTDDDEYFIRSRSCNGGILTITRNGWDYEGDVTCKLNRFSHSGNRRWVAKFWCNNDGSDERMVYKEFRIKGSKLQMRDQE